MSVGVVRHAGLEPVETQTMNQSKPPTSMDNDNALPRKKIRFLGNLLLVLSGLGLIAGLISIPLHFSHASPSAVPDAGSMIGEITELFLPGEVTADTTVGELLEKDRAFFLENRGSYQVLSLLSAVFVVLFALVFLRLAWAWRRAEPFGRGTVIGLRWLGILLLAQFLTGWIAEALAPPSELAVLFELVSLTGVYHHSISLLAGGGPVLSSGILLLILSWIVDYGRQLREEQALTI